MESSKDNTSNKIALIGSHLVEAWESEENCKEKVVKKKNTFQRIIGRKSTNRDYIDYYRNIVPKGSILELEKDEKFPFQKNLDWLQDIIRNRNEVRLVTHPLLYYNPKALVTGTVIELLWLSDNGYEMFENQDGVLTLLSPVYDESNIIKLNIDYNLLKGLPVDDEKVKAAKSRISQLYEKRKLFKN
jgi:hypothetical protein